MSSQSGEKADSQAARLHAHSIKGSAANIGGLEMSAAARKLEAIADSGDLASAEDVYTELRAGFDHLRPVLENATARLDQNQP